MEEQVLRPSGWLSPELRERAVEELQPNGAWLALSLLWYGWRAYYDLAVALLTGEAPRAEASRPTPIDAEFAVVRDLQVQGLLYQAAEQFSTLVVAAAAHQPGTSSFFDTYIAHAGLANRIADARRFSRGELADVLGEPPDVATARADLEARGLLEADTMSALLNPEEIATRDVGGLHVPEVVIERHAVERLVEAARELVDLVKHNLDQLDDLVSPPPAPPDEPRPRPLRDVDNSFRHGLRVLFHEAVPEERRFRIAGPAVAGSGPWVDVYLPGGRGGIEFATLSCEPDRLAEHLESLRQVCTRIGQFIRGFIGWKCLRTPGLLMSAAGLELGNDGSDAELNACVCLSAETRKTWP